MFIFEKPQATAMTTPPFSLPPVQIAYYDSVPAFIAPELERLYRHLNCSLSHFRFRQRAREASTYVAARDGRTTAIFVHVRQGRTITVLNEMVRIDAQDIAQFAHYVFERFGDVARIRFSMVGREIDTLPFPIQQHGSSEDIVIALPDTAAAYFSSLSSKTRQNIKYRQKTLQRDHPGLRFANYDDGDIDPRQVRELIALKHMQFRRKGVHCGLDDNEATWIAERARSGGLMTLALLDGKVCGGSVSHRIGDAYFATLVAYDPAFARHGLGMLCCYLTICEMVARGARRTHLGWGRNDYKFKLLGVRQDMANLDVYRSRLAWLGQSHRVLGHALRNRLQQAKLYLLAHEADKGALALIPRTIVRTARAVKRARFAAED